MERSLRLRREAEVRRARGRGRAWADGPLVARVLPNRIVPPQNRYTVIAGKKVGKSHERNRAKRLVRESLRLAHPRLRTGFDIVVIVRGTLDDLPTFAAADAVLTRIVARAGLLLPVPETERASTANSPHPPAPSPDARERGSVSTDMSGTTVPSPES